MLHVGLFSCSTQWNVFPKECDKFWIVYWVPGDIKSYSVKEIIAPHISSSIENLCILPKANDISKIFSRPELNSSIAIIIQMENLQEQNEELQEAKERSEDKMVLLEGRLSDKVTIIVDPNIIISD